VPASNIGTIRPSKSGVDPGATRASCPERVMHGKDCHTPFVGLEA
jgi:hypothetical protein